MITCKINGDLISENGKLIKTKILNQMENTDEIILDFQETNYIDSIGLGILVSIYKESVRKDITIRIKNTNANINKLLKITALDELFLIDNQSE